MVGAQEPAPPPEPRLRDDLRPAARSGLTVDPGKRLDTAFGAEQPRRRETGALQIAQKIVLGCRTVLHRPPDGVPGPPDPIRHHTGVPVRQHNGQRISRSLEGHVAIWRADLRY